MAKNASSGEERVKPCRRRSSRREIGREEVESKRGRRASVALYNERRQTVNESASQTVNDGLRSSGEGNRQRVNEH